MEMVRMRIRRFFMSGSRIGKRRFRDEIPSRALTNGFDMPRFERPRQ